MRDRAENVDEYISAFRAETAELLTQMRTVIKRAAPEAQEVISYAMPAYRLNGMLVYFAGHPRHIGFYPGAGGIATFKTELSVYKGAKGSVQFPLDRPLPRKLIERIVKFRVMQNLEKVNKR